MVTQGWLYPSLILKVKVPLSWPVDERALARARVFAHPLTKVALISRHELVMGHNHCGHGLPVLQPPTTLAALGHPYMYKSTRRRLWRDRLYCVLCCIPGRGVCFSVGCVLVCQAEARAEGFCVYTRGSSASPATCVGIWGRHRSVAQQPTPARYLLRYTGVGASERMACVPRLPRA